MAALAHGVLTPANSTSASSPLNSMATILPMRLVYPLGVFCPKCAKVILVRGAVRMMPGGAPEQVRSTPEMPKQVPPRGAPKGTIWVGGVVDETHVCLGVYGDDLDPDDVTVMLGREPTSSHRKGDQTKRGFVHRRGVWLLDNDGTAYPEELTRKLLDWLPKDEGTWVKLAKRYEVQLRFGLHLQRWNRGLDFTPQLVARMAKLHARIIFDVYGPGDALVDIVEHEDHRPVAARKPPVIARRRKSDRRP